VESSHNEELSEDEYELSEDEYDEAIHTMRGEFQKKPYDPSEVKHVKSQFF